MAKLISSWRMAVHIPAAIRQADEGFSSKDFLVIIKRANESRYYDKHAEQQACGCYAIGNYYTSYLMDCELHGWDAIFPDYKRETEWNAPTYTIRLKSIVGEDNQRLNSFDTILVNAISYHPHVLVVEKKYGEGTPTDQKYLNY